MKEEASIFSEEEQGQSFYKTEIRIKRCRQNEEKKYRQTLGKLEDVEGRYFEIGKRSFHTQK